jgi:hypothetical protein
LETLNDWGKTAPAPALPADVIEKTGAKYREALQRLTSAEAAVPPALRGVLAGLDAGESAIVAGVGGVGELVMLCSRIPQSIVPASRDDVQTALVNEKLALMATAYMQELRTQAIIVQE